MKIKSDSFKIIKERKMKEHEWFAWHPVRVDHHHLAWLQYVYREAWSFEVPIDFLYHYREIKNES